MTGVIDKTHILYYIPKQLHCYKVKVLYYLNWIQSNRLRVSTSRLAATTPSKQRATSLWQQPNMSFIS